VSRRGTAVSDDHIASFRLARHHLLRPAPKGRLVEVVSDIAGVQAQVSSAARLALRARVRGLTPDDVDRALWTDRSLVKTWCMRGATHLVPAAELAVYVRGLARRESRSERWMVRRGLEPNDVERLVAEIVRALDAGPLTRKELGSEVGARVGPGLRKWVEHAWGGVVMVAALRGVACFGPDRGNEITFARVDGWVRGWRDLPADQAEAELLRRYLHAFGPATVHDFAGWADFAIGDARAIWGRLAGDIAVLQTERGPAGLLREDLEDLRRSRPGGSSTRLLPNFDTFLLGHRDKGYLVDFAHYKQVYRKAGWISQVVLVDGHVAGVWSHEARGRIIWVTVEPFRSFSRDLRMAISREVGDVGRFLGQAVKLRIL